MTHQATVPRARRVEVDHHDPCIAGGRSDYADAYEIQMTSPDARSAEQFARAALEHAAASARATAVSPRSLEVVS